MHVEFVRSLLSPLRLWRTMLLMIPAGTAVAALTGNAFAVLCTMVVCAFSLSGFERRAWIVMPPHVLAGDVAVRISLAVIATFAHCGPLSSAFSA